MDTCEVSLQYGYMCEFSKIWLLQNFCHNVYTGKDVHLKEKIKIKNKKRKLDSHLIFNNIDLIIYIVLCAPPPKKKAEKKPLAGIFAPL